MSKSISEIKEEFGACDSNGLSAFISEYSSDDRAGVKALVTKAERKIEAIKKEDARLETMLTYERKYYATASAICGIDEVGRGPLAGPVVAGAVILPKDCKIPYINDSKKLTEKQREELFLEIKDKAVAYALGWADEKRIDEINILQATFEAMREAISKLSVKPEILLNDAVNIPLVDIPQVPIIKGDAKSASIAAASIIAKVTRDHFMADMDSKYPGYGFAGNKGYGSAEHIAAIKSKGPCEIHRRSFIKNFI